MAEGRSHLSPRLRSELQGSFWPHPIPQGSPLSRTSLANPPSSLRQSRWLGTDTPCPDVQPAAGFASLSGHTLPGSGPWCVLGNWPPRLMGEPLTLEDLTVPVQSQARAPSQTAIHQLLASVRHLEHEVARLGCRASQEPPGPAHRDPWTSSGRALPAHRQPGQPVLASWEGREKPVRGLRETADFPGTQGAQAGLSGGRASSKPASPEATLRMPTGDFLDPKQGALLANPARQGENFSPGPTYGSRPKRDPRLPPGVGNREARPCSAACSGAARGGPPGQEGREVALQELVGKEEERTASCPPDAAPARSALQVEARGGRAGEPGDLRSAPRNSLCRLATARLLRSPPRGREAGDRQAWCPALLALQPENLVLFFCFPRTKPETLGAWSPGRPGEAMGCGGAEGGGQLLSKLPGPVETSPCWRAGPGRGQIHTGLKRGGDFLHPVPAGGCFRCFRAWWHRVRKRRAVAAAVALGRRRLLRRGLQIGRASCRERVSSPV